MASVTSSGGCSPKAMRMPQAVTASGPIQRTRRAGATRRLNAMAPTDAPRACEARISPTATAPPPRLAASGAETPSGTLSMAARDPHSEEADRRTADHESQRLAELEGGERDGRAQNKPVTGQDVRVERCPSRGERRADQRHQDKQAHQPRDRHRWYCH